MPRNFIHMMAIYDSHELPQRIRHLKTTIWIHTAHGQPRELWCRKSILNNHVTLFQNFPELHNQNWPIKIRDFDTIDPKI